MAVVSCKKRLPAIGSPRQHPELALAGERGQVPPQGLLERRGVQRVRERLAEGHQPLELCRAHPGLGSLRGGGERLGLRLLPLAGLMEDEDARIEHLPNLSGQLHNGERLAEEGHPLVQHPVPHDDIVGVA